MDYFYRLNWSALKTFYIAYPLLVYALGILLLGEGWNSLKVLPEWSFISIILFSEYIRDSWSLRQREIQDSNRRVLAERKWEGSLIFGTVFIVLSTVTMFSAFIHQLHSENIDLDILTLCQIGFFVVGFLMVLSKKISISADL